MIQDLKKRIALKQAEIRLENDGVKKEELNKQLKKLQLQDEIENIKLKIAQLK